MKILTWKHTDWFARNFQLAIEDQTIGQLSFTNSWNINALYSDNQINLEFAQKSFWDRDVLVTKAGETLGEISSGLFGTSSLKLANKEKYSLSTSFWEQEVFWKTPQGETIIKYQQATMSSMAKGVISVNKELPLDTEKLLISSGLFIRQLARKRAAVVAVICLMIVAAANS